MGSSTSHILVFLKPAVITEVWEVQLPTLPTSLNRIKNHSPTLRLLFGYAIAEYISKEKPRQKAGFFESNLAQGFLDYSLQRKTSGVDAPSLVWSVDVLEIHIGRRKSCQSITVGEVLSVTSINRCR